MTFGAWEHEPGTSKRTLESNGHVFLGGPLISSGRGKLGKTRLRLPDLGQLLEMWFFCMCLVDSGGSLGSISDVWALKLYT